MEVEMPVQMDITGEPLLGAESIPREISVPPTGRSSYMPSAQTQLILNRISVTPRDYPPFPSRVAPRIPPPSYYDYDYGYGGYGNYGGGAYGYGGYGDYPRPARASRYDAYLDDEYDSPSSYTPRYGRATRLADAIVDSEKEKQLRMSPVRTTTTTTYTMPAFTHTRNVSPRMLNDEVDKMRIRLKGLSYSLDPNGPVPEIILPDRSRRATSVESAKRYSSGPKHLACVEYAGGVPQWKRKARACARYPIEDPESLSTMYKDDYEAALRSSAKDPERLILKDRLSMKIHTFLGDSMEPDKYEKYLKTYRNPGLSPKDAQWREEYYKPKPYKAGDGISNTYSSKYPATKGITSGAKWEEPDHIYGTDKQPYSKVETGFSLFASGDGITSCVRDTVAEKVRDYYYYGDHNKTADGDEDKKERRKKKKSKERDLLSSDTTSAIVSAGDNSGHLADAEAEDLDDKEKKKLEKKKRKAEREAAAKAAMEAELEALAAAEAELAMLEAQTGDAKPEEAAPVVEESAPEPVLDEPAPVVDEPAPAPAPEPEPVEITPVELEPEAPEEKCELIRDVPEEVIPDSYPIDDPQPSIPQVNDSTIQENDTHINTIDAQAEPEYTENTNIPLDNPIEPMQSSQLPIESEQTCIDEPVTIEPDLIGGSVLESDISSDQVACTDDTTAKVEEAPVESVVEPECIDQIVNEQEVQKPIIDQNPVEEVNEIPQQEEEYVQPQKKTFKADTDFDWGDFDAADTAEPIAADTAEPVDADTQQRGGNGEGDPVGGVEKDDVAISDDVFEFPEEP